MSVRMLMLIAALPVGIISSFFVPFIGLVWLILIYFVRPQIWGMPPSLSPTYLITGTMLVAMFLHHRPIGFPGNLRWMVLLLATMFLSSSNAVVSQQASIQESIMFLKLMVAAFLIVNLVNSPKRLTILLWTMVGGIFWLIKSALAAYLVTGAARTDNVGGQGGGANYMSLMLLITLPFLVLKALTPGQRRWEKMIALGLIPLWLIMFILAGSRAGLLAIIAMGGVLILQSQQKIKALLMAFVLGIFLLGVGSSLYWERMATIVEYEEDPSATSRLDLWAAALTMIEDRYWSGIGQGNFVLVSPDYTEHRAKGGGGLEAHNAYVQALAEGGIPMVVALLALFAVTFRRLLRIDLTAVAPGTRSDLTLLRQSIVLALVAYMVQAFFSSNLQKDPLWWLMGFAEALVCMAATATVPSTPVPAERPLAAAKPALLHAKTG